MRRSSSSPSIQLFPFLAVLVCAMGALILLLLVTTRKMRQVAQARAVAEEEERQSIITPPPRAELAPSGPTREELAALEADRKARQAEREARRTANAAARRRQSERDARLRRQVAEAEIARDQRRQTLDEITTELESLKQRLQSTENSLAKLRDKKSSLKSLQDHDAKWLAQAEREHAKLTEAIAVAQKKLAELRRAHADAASKYAFIPYDGAHGTTRRPIYIECTSTGIRFQPENELLDETDLTGFTETFNPLLLASEKLMQYWREQSALTDDPRKPMRPYVLLIVRSRGTKAYYVARQMLSQLGDDFGYELIEDEFPLQLPPADPEAKLVIRRAVAEALKNRAEMLAIGGRVGEARLGQVLMGRSEELIRFGTLDDQVAATEARKESPFAKNSPPTSKGFSVTRSPVQPGEMVSGGLKEALQDRERRRAAGTPNNLGSVRETASAPPPESRVPGSLAEMTRGPGGVGTGGSVRGGPAALVPNSTGARRGPAAEAYALSDPFSREHRATGKQGAGSVAVEGSRDEVAAGDSAANAADGSSNGSGTTGARNQRALPQGSRPGKVIDIPPDASPISETANPGSTGATGSPRSTGQRVGQTGNAQSRTGSLQDAAASTGSTNSRSGSGTSGQRPSGSRLSQAFSKSPNGAGNAPDITSGGANSQTTPRTDSSSQQSSPRVRSTDPDAGKNRSYGDNPEARQQLAATASKTATVMQKRDSGRRRWGGSNTGQIGFERKVQVQVMADKIIIGKNDIEIQIEPGTTQDELVESVLEGLDEHSRAWGKPPTRFYWVPFVNYEVYAGGNNNYERLHGSLRDWGIFSEAEFKPGDKPVATESTKSDTIQPTSATDGKLIGPAEAPGKTSGSGSATSRKTMSNWFKWFTPK